MSNGRKTELITFATAEHTRRLVPTCQCSFHVTVSKSGTSYEKLGGQIFFAGVASLFVYPPTYWGQMPFLPSSWSHACCDHNASESYRRTVSV